MSFFPSRKATRVKLSSSIFGDEPVDSPPLCVPLWWPVAGGGGDPGAAAPSSKHVRVFILVVLAFRRMTMFLLRVILSVSDPFQVCSSRLIRRSTGLDSRQTSRSGGVGGFLVVSGSSDQSKGLMVTVVALERWFLGTRT